jgi:predicted metal-dependent phosphoesterase TrpH
MTVDFHLHSTASDGSLTPKELAEKTKGFKAAALTDHDTVDGVAEFLSAEIGAERRFAGCEFSIETPKIYGEFHLLGLNFNIDNDNLHSLFSRIIKGRDERNLNMIRRLKDLGIGITEEMACKYAGGKVLGRPHIARALIEVGAASDISEAFTKYLVRGTPGYVERYRPQAKEVFDVIHEAGGLALMAHPKLWTTDVALLESGLRELKTQGLDGIEAVYSQNEIEETMCHLRLAKSLDFCVSAGSDFHGENKKMQHFGMAIDEGISDVRWVFNMI